MAGVVVAKFGGTSLGDARGMERSARTAADRGAALVVVSAVAGVTDRLAALASLLARGDRAGASGAVRGLASDHRRVARDLGVPGGALDSLEEPLGELESLRGAPAGDDPRTAAEVQAFGERLSSALFAWALGRERGGAVELVDARSVVRTDDRWLKARVDFQETGRRARRAFPEDGAPRVTQGFIGSEARGGTTLLGRGGSDYTAAVLAEALGAGVLEIWTDVEGVRTTDPRICPHAGPIREMTWEEAAELAVLGAKVLHPATLVPARRGGVRVHVGSSFRPDGGGTWIVEEAREAPLVRAVSKRDGQRLLTISTPRMLHAHGFLRRIFGVFDDFAVSVDAVTTSEVSVALTVEREDASDALLLELRRFAGVRAEDGFSLVSLVGNGVDRAPGFVAAAVRTLGDIDIRMVCHGASSHNLCLLVRSGQGRDAVARLHRAFIEEAA